MNPAVASHTTHTSLVSLECDTFEASVVMRSGINYALAHAQISPLVAIRLVNLTNEPLSGGRLELSFTAPLPGPIAPPLLRRIPDIESGETGTFPLSGGSWHLDPTVLAGVEEAVTGSVHVSVSFDGGRVAVERCPVTILARDEWWAASVPETLASFVTPRDRAVRRLMIEAGDLLKQRTGDPSLQGYQAGRARVLEIAEALYDAMRARDIRYSNPPASFEGTGQKVRRPSEVLDDGLGTCLDLSTTYCAALEAAGINPVIFLGHGHAFPGFLTEQEHQLDELVMTDAAKLTNWIDTGLIVPVESTALCDGTASPFREAVAAAGHRGWWSHATDEFEGVIDVYAAHRTGIRPLPTVAPAADAILVEEEPTAVPDHAVPGLAPAVNTPTQGTGSRPQDGPRGGERVDQTFPPRVARWRNSLLDLSLRNPLLNMSDRGKGVDLHIPAASLGRLEDMVFDGTAIKLVPSDQIAEIHRERGARTAQQMDAEHLAALLQDQQAVFASITEATYARKLRELHRTARLTMEETGANNLFLTLGSLRWNEGTRDLRSPLFLLPVTLTSQRRGPYRFSIEEGGFTLPNQCLVEKLRATLNMAIPEFEQPAQDESGIDVPASLAAIRRALIERELPFTVEEDARLGILQFSTLELWQDMSQHWEQFLRNPVVRHLVETPTDAFIDPVAEPPADSTFEATSFCPIPVDGSQLEAVRWARAGRSFVLEGPPGTGKSQTITNIISDALASGKRVLFVAEKQAALDVVKRRLDKVGLGDLCLDLHGKHQSPAEVRQQLSRALKRQTSSNAEAWDQLLARMTSLVEGLGRYPAALHEVGAAGLSAWTARQALLAAERGPIIELDRSVVTSGSPVEDLYAHARDLAAALYDLGSRPDDHAWAFAEVGDVSADVLRTTVSDAVREIEDALTGLAGTRALEVLRASQAPHAVSAMASCAMSLLHEHVEPLGGEALAGVREPGWPERVEELKAQRARLVEDAGHLLARFDHAAIMRPDLDDLLLRARSADGAFFLFRSKARRAVAAEFAPQLRDGAPPLEVGQLTHLIEQLIEHRAAARQWRDAVTTTPGLAIAQHQGPFDAAVLEPIDAQAAFAERLRRLGDAIGDTDAVDASLLAELNGEAGAAVVVLHETWTKLVEALSGTDASVERWRADRTLVDAISTSVSDWSGDVRDGQLLRLGRWARVRRHATALDAHGLGALFDEVRAGQLRVDDLEQVARRSIAAAALRERLTLPALTGFDGLDRDRRIEDFLERSNQLRDEMLTELPARVVSSRTFDATRMVGKAGELHRQLSRQRGGMKVRELMSNFGSIIGELTPCLLMSPHSVARFLPTGAVDIDLVIFDEASQIRVAEAIGAMGRGAATIVVGDSRQMPPSSIGRSLGDEDETEDERFVGVPADMESILSEAVDSQLPQRWLSWHYRSQDESLIAFSNQHYYDGRLASFPAPPEFREGFGISLRRVGGTFDRTNSRRINDAEIDAIVAEIRARLAADPGASIGVITMNAQQMKELDTKLDELEDAAVIAARSRETDRLFVKNLENVQGDEADLILFSLAFSPDPTTGRLSLNFGPLTTAGGERRLNVAVTRARREVILFTSFEPSHIDLSRTSSIGMAHLRTYMELADQRTAAGGGLRPATARDRHREEVVERLRDAGLLVQTELGLSEFTVDIAAALSEEGPWVAVFLDGPAYAGRSSVGDRETIASSVLVGAMGWSRVERVWLPAWLSEPDAVVERIMAAAKLPRPEPPAAPEPEPLAAAPEAIEPDAATVEPTAPHPSEVHPRFVEAASNVYAGDKTVLDRLSSHNARQLVLDQVNDIVAAEGPIEGMRLARMVARRFDLNRLAAKRAAEILSIVPVAQRQSTAFGVFVWPPDVDPASYDGFRVPGPDETRDMTEIAPEELVSAMCWLADVGHGVASEDLMRETAALFGVRRLAAKVRPRLEQAIEHGIALGKLENDGGFIIRAQAR